MGNFFQQKREAWSGVMPYCWRFNQSRRRLRVLPEMVIDGGLQIFQCNFCGIPTVNEQKNIAGLITDKQHNHKLHCTSNMHSIF